MGLVGLVGVEFDQFHRIMGMNDLELTLVGVMVGKETNKTKRQRWIALYVVIKRWIYESYRLGPFGNVFGGINNLLFFFCIKYVWFLN